MTNPAESLCYAISREVHSSGGRALLVGGCVRDSLLGITPKDFDMEVFGITEDRIETVLGRTGTVLKTGRAFPVWKVWTEEMGQGSAVDVALPRCETKVGEKHGDFTVTLNPHMTFAQAAYRRDFTMNAMGRDLITGELLDPFGGEHHLKLRQLWHVSRHFAEDPLRVLRGAQFCARFNLVPAWETIGFCRTLSPENLSAERLWGEWCKLVLKGVEISRGLRFLEMVGWLTYFPELEALCDVRQDPDHHPEGTAWIHTLHCMDAFAKTRIGDEREDLIVGFATLLHDTGKATTTTIGEDGKIHAYGHEEAGQQPTLAFLTRMTLEATFIAEVVALVVNHMRPTFLWKEATRGGTVKQMNRSLRRLAREVRLDRLARVVWNDKAGRPPKPQVSPEADWLKSRAAEIEVLNSAPKPILLGRHLIQLGMKPGVEFKVVLESAFSLQLDGEITTFEEALAYAQACARPPQPRDQIYPR